MIIQTKYDLLDVHHRGLCFNDFVVINDALFWVTCHSERWRNDIRDGEHINEIELGLYRFKTWNRGDKMIFGITEEQASFGRGFKLGDIVCIDGEWYECIRETHQNKGGLTMYEYEFIRVDTPKVTAAILGWKSKPKDDPDEPTVFQSAIDDDDDADDEGWMV